MHAVSFGLQTNHIRQPLNNHTRPFYFSEVLSKVQNTVSNLSGGNDPGGGEGTLFARVTFATQGALRRIALRNNNPNHKEV